MDEGSGPGSVDGLGGGSLVGPPEGEAGGELSGDSLERGGSEDGEVDGEVEGEGFSDGEVLGLGEVDAGGGLTAAPMSVSRSNSRALPTEWPM